MKRLAPLVLAVLAFAPPALAAPVVIGAFTVVAGPVGDPAGNRSYAYADGARDPNTSLVLRCHGERLEIAFDPNAALGDGKGGMTWRLDDRPASAPFPHDVSGSGTLAYLPTAEKTRFLRAAAAASEATLRVVDARGTVREDRFSLAGLRAAIDRLGCA